MAATAFRREAGIDPLEAGVALFLALFLGHLLGDFVFQPGRLVVAKRHGARGMLLHTGIVTVCTALVLLGQISRFWPAAVIAALAHLGIEHLSVRARHIREASGLALFLLDQALHIVSLAIIAALMGSASEPMLGTWGTSNALLAAACGVVAVAFLGSILAFEVRVVAMGDDAPPEPILRLDLQRAYGFAERAGALLVGLVSPMPGLAVLLFLPRTAYALSLPPAQRIRQMTDVAVGLILCIVAWAFIVVLANTGF
jgi:hypothetical protein